MEIVLGLGVVFAITAPVYFWPESLYSKTLVKYMKDKSYTFDDLKKSQKNKQIFEAAWSSQHYSRQQDTLNARQMRMNMGLRP
jgi:hypothetical protein